LKQSQSSEYDQLPVGIDEFIDSSMYLDMQGVVYPEIRNMLRDIFIGKYEKKVVEEAAIDAGIGSGKSFLSSIIIAYMLHRTLCLKNPAKTFKLAPGSNIAFMNMGINAVQARKVVFGEIKNKIDNCRWFKEHYPADPNVKSELRFPKNILVLPGNSRETFPLGFNILASVLDEAAFYSETAERDVAEEIYNAMQRRIRSRFGTQGLLVMISSPRYIDDFIERKIEEAKINPKIYAARRPTWRCKPKELYSGVTFYVDVQRAKVVPTGSVGDFEGLVEKAFDGPVHQKCDWLEVPEEYRSEFDRDARKALRDYAAKPSLTLEPAILDPEILNVRCNVARPNPINEKGQLEPWFRGQPRLIYTAHVDLAVTQDSAGFAIGHGEMYDGELHAVIDLMMRIEPPYKGQIRYSEIRQKIYDLRDVRGFNFGLITCDRFQSVDFMQILNDKGFKTMVLSVDKDGQPYDTLISQIGSGRVNYYKYTPFIEEMSSLQRVKGSKYDHPSGGCFTADTKVKLVDGRSLTFPELIKEWDIGKDNWVYTIDFDQSRLRPALLSHPRKTKTVTELAKVELDDDGIIYCTPDHLFMLRDGEYKEAKDLHSRESLMPCYTKQEVQVIKDYRMVFDPTNDTWYYEHHYFADKFPDKEVDEIVHHRNGNKDDNRPPNLATMTRSAHTSLHRKNGSVKKNHMVKRVTVGKVAPTDVYDLTVSGTDNFALDSGVFVHNSKDVSDAVCGVVHTIMSDETNWMKQQQFNSLKPIIWTSKRWR